jgi:site-specific recombinase XerD
MINQTSSQNKTYSLHELIEYYEVCNRSEGKSPKTISWYTANLKSFLHYLKSRHLPDSIDNIDIKLLREYVLFLLNRKRFENHPYTPTQSALLSPSTVHCHVRTLRAFYSWLLREGLIDHNPAIDLKPPKIVKKVLSTLSDQEIKTIINTLNPASPSDARNLIIFMLLIDTGLRIEELINLRLEDLQMKEGWLKVIGKGKKERIVPIGSNAQRALQRYIFRHRPKPVHQDIDNVFLTLSGTLLSTNSMKLMFTRLAARSGVHRLHAHLCRHTFATRFLVNGGDVFSLQ